MWQYSKSENKFISSGKLLSKCVISCQILFSTDIDDLLWFENTSTPFHLASWQGHLDEVKWLAERIGYQSLLQGFNGWSPCMLPVMAGIKI